MVARTSLLTITGCVVAGLATLTSSFDAQAHSIWFAERARQLALIYGVGADDLDAVRRLDKVTSVTGYDENWQPVETKFRVVGAIPVIDSAEPVAIVAAVMDYGDWAKTPDGKWHNANRKAHPDAVLSEHNFKYALHINKMPNGAFPMLEGHKLQIVPVSNVLPQSMGMPIILKAYYDGKPTANVNIITDYVNDPDQIQLVTGEDGTVTFPVRNQGLNVVTAVYLEKFDDTSVYDHKEHRATLTFILPHLPE